MCIAVTITVIVITMQQGPSVFTVTAVMEITAAVIYIISVLYLRTTPRKPSDEEARKSRRYSVGSLQPMGDGRAMTKNRNKLMHGQNESREPE